MAEETEVEEVTPGAIMPVLMGQIAVQEDVQYIIPQTIEEAYQFARLAVHVAPDSYGGDIKKVTLAIMAGMEAGVQPLFALRNIAIINGRPTMYGDLLLALVQSKNLIERQIVREIGPAFDETWELNKWPDDYGFTVSIWRRRQEEPYVGKFTVGDAKRAKLWLNTKKPPWIEHPKRMLLTRARTFPLRDGFADALGGLAIREEIEDMAAERAPADTAFLDDEDNTDGTATADTGTEIEGREEAARDGGTADTFTPGAKD